MVLVELHTSVIKCMLNKVRDSKILWKWFPYWSSIHVPPRTWKQGPAKGWKWRFLLKIILGRYWSGSLDFASFWKKPCVRLQNSEMHSDYTSWRNCKQDAVTIPSFYHGRWWCDGCLKEITVLCCTLAYSNRDSIAIHGIPNEINKTCSHTHTCVESEWFGKEARINKKRLTYAWPGQKHETLWVFPWNMPADINRAAENELETPQHRKRRKNTCLLTCKVIARALGV